MKIEDLTRTDFNPNQLSEADGIRFRYAEEALATGNNLLADQMLQEEADDYGPMRLSLWLANSGEHDPTFILEWNHLTR